MGQWTEDANGKWQYDEHAPSLVPEVTALRPRPPSDAAYVEVFDREDGPYGRPDPEQFNVFDCADSTTITDDGGPPDAA